MTNLVIPTDGPRIGPRTPEQVDPDVLAALDKATDVWGIPNNLARTMACHPMLVMTEIDYVDSFLFKSRCYGLVPRPGAPTESILFPLAGFVDRITKELVIIVSSLLNRSRYSITHHTVIGYGTVSNLVPGADEKERSELAEALLLNTIDGQGNPIFEGARYKGRPLYSDFQICAMKVAVTSNTDAHAITDDLFAQLRNLARAEARNAIASGPLSSAVGASGPDNAYLDAYVDGMLVELTWCIAHFGGLLNRWFTMLKLRDELFDVAPGQNYVDVYNASVPESIKARNNQILGPDGWGDHRQESP